MDSEEKETSPVEETSRNDHPEIDSNKPGDNPVELIRNENQIDITGDGGLLKEIRTQGEGDDGPLSGDKVFVHYIGTLLDGTTFDSSRDRGEEFNFVLGKGSVIKAWDQGVATMKKGERSILTCTSEYAYGKNGSPPKIGPNATLVFDIELFRWTGEDFSPDKDGSICKSLIKQGSGYKTPNDGATVNIHYVGRYNGSVFETRDVEFTIGDGSEFGVVEGIEIAIKHFKQKETSKLTIASKFAYGADGNTTLNIPSDAMLEYEVELKSFEKSKESWEMDADEKLEQSELAKTKGTNHFKNCKYAPAITQYKKIITYLENESGLTSEQEEKSKALRLAAHLNIAMCHLKLGSNDNAESSCDKALDLDKKNVKGLYRRGLARMNKNDYDLARNDFTKVIELDPTNTAAKKQITIANQKLKVFNDKQKKLYSGMFEKFAAKDSKNDTTPPEANETQENGQGEAKQETEKTTESDSESAMETESASA